MLPCKGRRIIASHYPSRCRPLERVLGCQVVGLKSVQAEVQAVVTSDCGTMYDVMDRVMLGVGAGMVTLAINFEMKLKGSCYGVM